MKEMARVLKPGGDLLAQINFHAKPTPAELICLSHRHILKWADRYGLKIQKIEYQYRHEGLKEDRYFYKCIHV